MAVALGASLPIGEAVGRQPRTDAARRGQGRASKPSPKPASEIGTPMPSSGVWKMTNIACLPDAELLDQRIVHEHLRRRSRSAGSG